MTEADLEKWWWWKKEPPPRYFEQAAYNYELASRARDHECNTEEPKEPRYLLGKPFDQLSAEQKALVNRRIWPTKQQRRPQPVEFLSDWQEPPALRAVHLMRSSEHLADAIEQKHVEQTGCTFPCLVTFDLRASMHSIHDAVETHVRAQRKKFGIPESKTQKDASIEANTGNAKRRRRKPWFEHIEALDLWRNLRSRGKYDKRGGQQARAAKEAMRLRKEWNDKSKELELAKQASDKETARLYGIIRKLQRGVISDVQAAAELWPNSTLAKWSRKAKPMVEAYKKGKLESARAVEGRKHPLVEKLDREFQKAGKKSKTSKK